MPKTRRAAPDGFFVREEDLLEDMNALTAPAGPIRRKLAAGGSAGWLLTARCPVDDNAISFRRFAAETRVDAKPVFRGGGLLLRSRHADITSGSVYLAADQIGSWETDIVGAVLSATKVESLFAFKTLLILSPWESIDKQIAAAVVHEIISVLKAGTVAIDATPLAYIAPPRPDAATAQHGRYRKALAKRTEIANALAVNLGSACKTVLFSLPFRQTGDEQLATLQALLQPPPSRR